MRASLIRAATCLPLVAVLGLACQPPPSSQEQQAGTEVAVGVSVALAHSTTVRVVIELRQQWPLRAMHGESGAHTAVDPLDEALRDHAIVAHRTHRGGRVLTATIDGRGLLALQTSPRVQRVAMDHSGHAHLAQALPLAGFAGLQADEGLTGAGITVAVLDTGVDRAHPDIAGALVDEACFCGTGCCPSGNVEQTGYGAAQDDHGHGTHIAGAILGRGLSNGQAGAAPASALIAIKVLDGNAGLCCMSDAIAGLEWLLEAHPELDIVNLSFGTSGTFSGECDDVDATTRALADVVAELHARGVTVLASSGNAGASDGMAVPACMRSVISVGAVWDEDVGPESILCVESQTAPDRIACFSNASATTDLVAPGARITASWPGGGARARVGTSNAASIASGCAALLHQADPLAGATDIAMSLRASPTWLLDARNGRSYPRLDCRSALFALRSSRLDAGPPDSGLPDTSLDDAGLEFDGGDLDGDASALDADFEDASAPLDGTYAENDATKPPGDGSAGNGASHDGGGTSDATGGSSGAGGQPNSPSPDSDAQARDADTNALGGDTGAPARPDRLPDPPQPTLDGGCACTIARSAPPSPSKALALMLAVIACLTRLRTRMQARDGRRSARARSTSCDAAWARAARR